LSGCPCRVVQSSAKTTCQDNLPRQPVMTGWNRTNAGLWRRNPPPDGCGVSLSAPDFARIRHGL
jgi:hypothetical protein